MGLKSTWSAYESQDRQRDPDLRAGQGIYRSNDWVNFSLLLFFFSSQEILDFKVLSIKQTQESTQRRREPPEEIQGWKDPEKEQQSNGAMFPPASQG